VVGRSADECHCPLAHFYSLFYDVVCEVTTELVRVAGSGLFLRRLPGWMIAFDRALDFTYTGDEITGQQALTLLEGVQA
jgi:hypothetical protein